MRVTPVPIPNTMVKTQAADGTSLETVRESRWPPGHKKLMNLSKINKLSFLGRSLTSEANFNWEIHIDTGKR